MSINISFDKNKCLVKIVLSESLIYKTNILNYLNNSFIIVYVPSFNHLDVVYGENKNYLLWVKAVKFVIIWQLDLQLPMAMAYHH